MKSVDRPYSRNSHMQKTKSLWSHTLWAVFFFLLLGCTIAGAVHFFGNPSDADTSHRVKLKPLPQATMADSLNGMTETLPDLLEGEVDPDENPTVQMLDALGNPVEKTNGLAGGTNNTPQPKRVNINQLSLIKAPIQALQKNSPFGPIPAIARDGRKAVTSYARPVTALAGTKPVSLIIGGLGVNIDLTNRAIDELPADVTLSFAAHATNLQDKISRAREKGHEVLLELPMENTAFDMTEPGAKRALMANGDNIRANNLRNLDWMMSRAGGYFGVTNYNGDIFLNRSDAIIPVLKRLSDSGLGFVFDGSTAAPSLPALANASAIPFSQAYTLIDSTPDSASIQDALAKLTSQAQAGNAPLGVGFSYPQTIDAAKAYIDGLPALGLSLVPASATLKGVK